MSAKVRKLGEIYNIGFVKKKQKLQKLVHLNWLGGPFRREGVDHKLGLAV